MGLVNEEIDVYERYVKETINSVISNKQLDYLKDINTGIFPCMVLNDFSVLSY